jgi:hypothetical protein
MPKRSTGSTARGPGGRESPEQLAELKSARKAFEELRPHGPRDAEAAYARDPSLASEAARGNANRAIRALQLETELRTNPELRADGSSAVGTSCPTRPIGTMRPATSTPTRTRAPPWQTWPGAWSAIRSLNPAGQPQGPTWHHHDGQPA